MKMKSMQFGEVVGDKGLFVDGDWVESKDQDPNGEVRLIQLADIGVGEFLNKSNRRLTMEKAQKLRCTFLEKGDLLVARMPDPIGRTCIFPGGHGPCATVVDVCVVRPDPEIVFVPWLNRVLNTSVFQHEFSKFITGTTRQRISRRNLETTPLVVPPLPEQKRIADILDKADAIRRKRAQALELTDQFLQSVFLDMFGDPVTNPKGWEVKSFGDLLNFTTGKLDSNAAVVGGEYPFFTCSRQNLTIDHYAFDQEALLLAGNNASADYSVKHYCGKFNAYQRTYVITLKNRDHQYEYFKLVLGFALNSMKAQSKGTNTKYLTLGILKNMTAQVPSVALQKAFHMACQNQRRVKQICTTAASEADSLFNSLIQNAFGGKL
jgi:type I restriction enzyme S subunit